MFSPFPRGKILIFVLLLTAGFAHGQARFFAGVQGVPAVVFTAGEGFGVKPQASVKGELRTGILFPPLPGERFAGRILPSLVLAGGYRYTAPSGLDGGYSYSGISEFTAGFALGALGTLGAQGALKNPGSLPRVPRFPHGPWSLGVLAGVSGTYSVYLNTYNYFFTPLLTGEVFLEHPLKVFKRGQELLLRASLPLEWRFRRDTYLDLSLGLGLGVSFVFGGAK